MRKVCFLDIETTGLSFENDEITIVGIYDGYYYKQFINGINLEEFKKELPKYDVIVTFNGKHFDIPFIEKKLDIKIEHEHYDLRFLLKELGLTGGLKKIERQLGILRDDDVKDVDGKEAVRLWYRYKRLRDIDALKLLLKYNKEDIVNLKYLLNWYIEEKSGSI